MTEYGPERLREEDVRRMIRDETMGAGEGPPQAPIADPTPLGLAGFALTTFILSCVNAQWLSPLGTFIPLAFFYGGLAQLLAGMWEFRNNNTFGALVFTSFGAFWGAFAFFFFFAEHLGMSPPPQEQSAVGFTLVGWTVFTLYLWIASLKVNKAVFVIFCVFMLTLILLDIGFLVHSSGLIAVGGYAGILLAVTAWYTSAAGLLNHVFGRTVLPVGSPFGEGS